MVVGKQFKDCWEKRGRGKWKRRKWFSPSYFSPIPQFLYFSPAAIFPLNGSWKVTLIYNYQQKCVPYINKKNHSPPLFLFFLFPPPCFILFLTASVFIFFILIILLHQWIFRLAVVLCSTLVLQKGCSISLRIQGDRSISDCASFLEHNDCEKLGYLLDMLKKRKKLSIEELMGKYKKRTLI